MDGVDGVDYRYTLLNCYDRRARACPAVSMRMAVSTCAYIYNIIKYVYVNNRRIRVLCYYSALFMPNVVWSTDWIF